MGAAFALLITMSSPGWAQQGQLEQQIDRLPWQTSPSVAVIGSVAQVTLTGNLRFLGTQGTKTFLELNGNPPRDNEYTIAPRGFPWFAILVFDATGYVRDDEQLDPDELLKTLQDQNKAGLDERRRLNLPLLRMAGWAIPPHYDVQTRRLEWGTRLLDEDNDVTVNYSARILSRSGVMKAILVSDPEHLTENVQQFHAALRGFDFNSGERYSEYRQGDRIAQYGLAALVVGGAAAAAASTGAMKGLGKVIAIGVFGAMAAVGGFFKRIFGKKA